MQTIAMPAGHFKPGAGLGSVGMNRLIRTMMVNCATNGMSTDGTKMSLPELNFGSDGKGLTM